VEPWERRTGATKKGGEDEEEEQLEEGNLLQPNPYKLTNPKPFLPFKFFTSTLFLFYFLKILFFYWFS
jgi:hypothetical protein